MPFRYKMKLPAASFMYIRVANEVAGSRFYVLQNMQEKTDVYPVVLIRLN